MKRKFLVIILSILIIISIFSSIVLANEKSSYVISSYQGSTANDGGASASAKKMLSDILAIVRTAGVAIAVVILLVIGTKYMIASAGDRADIKKYAIKYIIGAVILFGASGILTIIQKFTDESITPE